MATDLGELTRLLQDHRQGDRGAFDALMPLVYEQLRRISRGQLRRMPRGETLDTTGLVHEAYMQLVDETGVDYQDRGHFLAIAARAMRRIAVDHVRRRMAAKRGGGQANVTLEDEQGIARSAPETVLAIHRALDEMATFNERLVRVVECRYFAGMTEEETAEALGVTSRTVQRDWVRAKAWLLESLSETGDPD